MRKINKRYKFAKGKNKAAFHSQITFSYKFNSIEYIDNLQIDN